MPNLELTQEQAKHFERELRRLVGIRKGWLRKLWTGSKDSARREVEEGIILDIAIIIKLRDLLELPQREDRAGLIFKGVLNMSMFGDIAKEALLHDLIEKLPTLKPDPNAGAMFKLGFSAAKKKMLQLLQEELVELN